MIEERLHLAPFPAALRTWLRQIGRALRLLAAVGLGGYGLGLLLYLPLRLLIGDGLWWLSLLNNLALLLFLPLILALPGALLLRLRRIALLLGGLAVIGLLWFGPLFLPKGAAAASGPTLRIVTFNVLGSNNRLGAVEAWLRTVDADLVFMQEIPATYSSQAVPGLLDLYPYQRAQSRRLRAAGQMMLSKFPILEASDIDLEGDGRPSQQRFVLDVDGQPVVVYNVHFAWPVRQTPRFNLPFPEPWWLSTATHYDDSIRNHQIEQLLSVVAAETGPVIVVGDFNMAEQAVHYGLLAGQLVDSFREVSFGLGASWPAYPAAGTPGWLPPLIRIDYIWHNAAFRAMQAAVGPELGSDHFPQYATLVLCTDEC